MTAGATVLFEIVGAGRPRTDKLRDRAITEPFVWTMSAVATQLQKNYTRFIFEHLVQD